MDKDLQKLIYQFQNHTHDGINTQSLVPKNLLGPYLNSTVVVPTNGTTPVSVFNTSQVNFSSPFALIVTGVFLISLDTTAGNITVYTNSGNIATIAKGTVQGAMIGAISLDATYKNVALNQPFNVVSSSSGNAFVYITYRVPYF